MSSSIVSTAYTMPLRYDSHPTTHSWPPLTHFMLMHSPIHATALPVSPICNFSLICGLPTAKSHPMPLRTPGANYTEMNAAWHPPPTTIKALYAQLKCGAHFADTAGEAIPDLTIVWIGYNLIFTTGLFNDACRNWHLHPGKKIRHYQGPLQSPQCPSPNN